MFSQGQRRKPTAPAKDLFGGFTTSTAKVLVRTVVKPKPAGPPAPNAPRTSSPLSTSPEGPSSSASTSKASDRPKRKRAPSVERDAVEEVKKPRRSKDLDRVSSPLPSRSTRSSQSRSTGHGFGTLEKPVPRPSVVTDEDGSVPHVTSDEIVTRFMTEADSGKKGKKGYKAFFKNPADPEDTSFDPAQKPSVIIEYPNHGASERFILLHPTDRDDYQPIRELMRTIDNTVEFYLTPAQRAIFGSLTAPSNLLGSAPSPSPSRPLSPAPNRSTPNPETSDTLLRTLEKAYNTRNGPLFVRTVESISTHFHSLKTEMMQNAKTFFDSPPLSKASSDSSEAAGSEGKIALNERLSSLTGGVPVKLWKHIMEEVYQRSVGPDVEDTKKYKSFSSQTYGELNPIFVSDLIHRFGLGPGKTFVDLGCGVGNCVLQAALQAGCDSYGIELNHPVAALGFVQQREFHARLRMWGLTAAPTTLREGDFNTSDDVSEWIRKADVVLVNNYIFDSDTNDQLTWRFLDLREGAKVVVLKPFWPLNRPLNERTAHGPEAVLASGVERMEYITDSVSWTKEPGEFFIYTKSDGRMALESERRSSRTPRS